MVSLTFFILSIVVGVMLGVFSGLLPGFHINNLALILFFIGVSYFPNYMCFPFSLYFSTLLLSSAISHVFHNFLSSLWFKVTEEDTYLSPSLHVKTFKYMCMGALFSFPLLLLFLYPLSFFLPVCYRFVLSHLPLFLILLMFLLLPDISIPALFVGLSSFVLGYLAFSSSINSFFVLSPLFIGFFSLPSFLSSQTSFTFSLHPNSSLSRSVSLSLLSLFCVFLSSLIPSSSPTIFFQYVKNVYDRWSRATPGEKERNMAIMIGALSMSDALFSIYSLYFISNSRSGVGVIISSILPSISFNVLVIFLVASSFSLLLSHFISSKVHSFIMSFSRRLHSKRCFVVCVVFVMVFVFYFTSFLGLFMLFLATLLGIIAREYRVNPSFLLLSLTLPLLISLI